MNSRHTEISVERITIDLYNFHYRSTRVLRSRREVKRFRKEICGWVEDHVGQIADNIIAEAITRRSVDVAPRASKYLPAAAATAAATTAAVVAG